MNIPLTYQDALDFLNDRDLLQEKAQTTDVERTYNLLKNILQAIKCNNIYEAYNLMYVHLRLNKNTRYFCLFTYFILDLYINDSKNYLKILKMLINPDEFVAKIKPDIFQKQFWYNLKKGNLNGAKVYSGIIYELNKLNFFVTEEEKKKVSNIHQTLHSAKEKTNYDYDRIFKGSTSVMHRVLENPPRHEVEVYAKAINDLCNYKIKKLQKFGGAIIFPNYDEFRIKIVLNILNQREELKCQIVETSGGKKLIIKLHNRENINMDALYKEYEEAKTQKNYSRCEKVLLKIIEHTEKPSGKLYASLAYTLFKQKNIVEAHKYYEIANYSYFKNEGIRPFDKIIETLIYAETKPLEYFNVTSEIENYTESFGIDEKTLREIRIYFLGKKRMTIDQALYYYNLKEQESMAVKLAIAKAFVINGEKRTGYEILENIKAKLEKDKCLKKHYEDFYENRHLYELSGKIKR